MKKFLIWSAFAVTLAALIILWWYGAGVLFGLGTMGVLAALGRLFGLLAVYFVLMQFVLVGRSIWIERTFGLDRLTVVHHWNGFLAFIFIILHPVCVVASYAMANQISFLSQLKDLLLNYEDVLPAFLALILFTVIVCFSIYIGARKWKYEYWYYIHLGTYLAVILAWGHQLQLGEDFTHTPALVYYWYLLYAGVLGNFLFWRFGRPIRNFYRHRFFVSRVVRETPSAVSVYISGKDIGKFRMMPGQFLILRFLAKGYWSQAHPFSLSMVPKNNELRITVKNVGDFTALVPDIPPGTPVLINGPYGIYTESLATKDKLLFLAGGIGITPIRAMIEALAGRKDIALIYGNRSASEIALKGELDTLAAKYSFPVYYVMSAEPGFAGEKGKIDLARIARLVPDFKEREIYICGPKPMLAMVRKELGESGMPFPQIHFEKFSLQ